MKLPQLRRLFSAPEAPPEAERTFAVPAGTRVYAIGDIHGRADLLNRMLTAIESDARSNPDAEVIEIFLGDYIDRGMQSREVIDTLLTPSPLGHERICLLGNHEETLLKFMENPGILRDWANFGGYATLDSYGIPIPESMSSEQQHRMRDELKKNLPPTHMHFLKNLRTHYLLGDYLFVHAGITPELPLAEQRSEHMLWIREPFLKHERYFDQYVVHGHSPVAAPDIRHNRANLDVTGADVDSLCCLVIEGETRRPLLIIRG